MNYIKHLNGFFEKVSLDYDLNPTHISLYMAIFQMWNQSRFQNQIHISRDELMRISKIASTATYHKCLKELTQKGYVIYQPSFNPFKGSLLEVCNLDFYIKPIPKKELKKFKNQIQTSLEFHHVAEQANEQANEQVIEQALNKHQTGSEQALNSLPIIYNKHNKTYTNNINLGDEQTKKDESQNEIPNDFVETNSQHQKKNYPKPTEGKFREKKDSDKPVIPNESEGAIPELDLVKNFFHENNFPFLEAEKFFNYFQSNGWLVGGKTKMKNWKAGARNWMLNSQKFRQPSNQPKPNHLQTPISKNYGEPL